MKKEREKAFAKIEGIYTNDLECKIESYIILFETESLEKLLNEVFKGHKIKKIKIELNYKMGRG